MAQYNGLADITVWLTDEQGKLKVTKEFGNTGVFTINLMSSAGATQFNMSGLNPTLQKVYGSNVLAEQQVGAAQPSITIGANDIPHKVSDLLIGLEADTNVKGGYASKNTKASMGGVIAHSNGRSGADYYIAFPLGTFTAGNMNLQTDTNNPVSVHDAITFGAQARPSDGLLYERFYSDDDEFDKEKMLTYIIDGYKKDVSSTIQQAASTQQHTA